MQRHNIVVVPEARALGQMAILRNLKVKTISTKKERLKFIFLVGVSGDNAHIQYMKFLNNVLYQQILDFTLAAGVGIVYQ
ncbi:hypothetical protein CEXT_581951 [Caerostris extrusa]|uniref:Uncharacterized protein n=1 Tax=Caerostris extrusa TaxID=172846 RepID=A0AAV4MD99_CAEEX|nr:hypothetical protein CEXT_581951 [Caerostris extrusa]